MSKVGAINGWYSILVNLFLCGYCSGTIVSSWSDIIFTTALQQYRCVAVVKIMKNQAKNYFHNWNTTQSHQFSQLPECDHIYASGHRASQRFLLYPNLNLPNLEKYQFYELHKTKYRKGST